MNQLQLSRVVDEIATRDPERLGYGYADTQYPWHHRPAIDLSRAGWVTFLAHLETLGALACVLQVGRGAGAGGLLSLVATARRVVVVERPDARCEQFQVVAADVPDRVVLLPREGSEAQVAAAVHAVMPRCEMLLLDGDGDYERIRADWAAFAPFVVAGGLVAIVDRAQTGTGSRSPFGVDTFVIDLERDVLVPHGVRLRRFGGCHAVHAYVQTLATRHQSGPPRLPPGFQSPPRPELLRRSDGLGWFGWRGRVVVVPEADGPLRQSELDRNRYDLVLAAPTLAAAMALVATWNEAEPRLAAARAQLRAGHEQVAALGVRAVAEQFPALRADLIPCLELAPWNRRLLLALGMLELFGQTPRVGMALLRRAIDLELMDAELLQTVATAYLRVLEDEAGARGLLAVARQQVRRRKVATTCRSLRGGHVLWHYPQLLADVHGVLQVGAHRGEDVAAFCALEIGEQLYVEANPAICDELAEVCRRAPGGKVRMLQAAVGACAGSAMLRSGENTARASLSANHALARVPGSDRQQHMAPVAVTTLDQLAATGAFDPGAYDLLFVDTEGTELDVLRGAVELLRRVELVCVAVFFAPVYEGVPMPQEIQTFLREIHDGDGFVLAALEPLADPTRGQAVFRRVKVR